MIVDLQKNAQELFLPLYYKLEAAKTRYVLNYGGSGSGKSYSQHQLELVNLLDSPTHDTLIIRKFASDIEDSSYSLLKNIAEDWGIKDLFGWAFSNSKRQITSHNGKAIKFRGLDDPEKIKSIAGIKRIIVEEASQLNQEDFEELMRRCRGISGIQIILLFNPIDERHWIKKMFFDSGLFVEGVDFIALKTTYLDNPHTTEEDIRQFEILKKLNYAKYRVYALAEWGILENKNPWFNAFDEQKHIAPNTLKLIPTQPVHLSFDFNINPMTCIAFQHTKHYGSGSYIHVLREFELKNTTLRDTCRIVKGAFPHSVFTVTGDATGRNRNAGYSSGSDNLWIQVKNSLNLAASQILTPGSNPHHRNSRELCNWLLQEHPNLKIDPSCKGLISDLLTARPIETENQDRQDQLLKGAGDSEIGMNLADCFRYMAHTHHASFLNYRGK